MFEHTFKQKRKECKREDKKKGSRKGRRNKNKKSNKRNRENKDTKKEVLKTPLNTLIRSALLLPPTARLRFTLNRNSQTIKNKVWGLREAMTEATMLFTAWDGTSNGTKESFQENIPVINVSLPFCSNGVSNLIIQNCNTIDKKT